MRPQNDKSTAWWIVAGVLAVVFIALAILMVVASGHSTGDSGEGRASAIFLSLLGAKNALAAGPPAGPPVYPGVSEDGGTSEGTADGAPAPDEVPAEDDNGAVVDDNGQAISAPESPPAQPPAKAAVPEATTSSTAPPTPAPPRAGYCDAAGKFYDLAVGQQETDPFWAAKGPWTDAYTDPTTGTTSCDFPRKEEPKAPIIQQVTATRPVSKPKPVAPARTGFVTITTPGYDGQVSFRVNIFKSLKNGTKVSQQRRMRNNETITFKLPPGATSKVKFNGAKCAGWYLKGTTPSSLHWAYEATRTAVSDDPKCLHYRSSTPQ